MQPDEKFYIQSVNRALSLISAIAKSGRNGATLSELARAGLPVSTAYRILRNLVAWRYVAEQEDGRYVLGSELIRLGEIARNNTEIVAAAREHLRQLAYDSGQTVYMTALDLSANDIYYVEKVRSRGTIQLAADVGTRNYIHSTANGKVLVSGFSNQRIVEILEKSGMPALTEKTLTTRQAFIEEVESVRESGYALDLEENEKNVVCVASPVYGRDGRIVASISVSGIKNVTLTRDLDREISLVTRAAAVISEAMLSEYAAEA